MDFFKKSPWIWVNEVLPGREPVFVCFRKELELHGTGDWTFQVTADSAYRLYLDGRIISRGPVRGDGNTWYYDTASASVGAGRHVLAAEVLRYPPEYGKNEGIWRTKDAGF